MQRNPVLANFLLKTVLWLPICLALWYWLAEWFNGPAALLSGWVMRQAFPSWVDAAEWSQRTVSLVTKLKLDSGVGSGHQAVLVAQANPLVYSYGMPLYAALILAGGTARKWSKLLAGILLLVPFQAWGICFDLLKQIAITATPTPSSQPGFDPWQREAIALCYQLGTLILPTLAPIVMWLSFNRLFIPMLMLEAALLRDDKESGDSSVE